MNIDKQAMISRHDILASKYGEIYMAIFLYNGAHKLLEAWKVYCNSQDSEKLKLENEMLKQMLRDQINGKLETAKLLKEVLEK